MPPTTYVICILFTATGRQVHRSTLLTTNRIDILSTTHRSHGSTLLATCSNDVLSTTHNPQVHRSTSPATCTCMIAILFTTHRSTEVHTCSYIYDRHSVHSSQPTGPQRSKPPATLMHDRYSIHNPQLAGPHLL